MKCQIAGGNARLFSKFIYFLSKVGDELYLHGLNNGLQLKTKNSSSSGFVCIELGTSFFTEFTLAISQSFSPENFCLVSIKPCLSIFKNMKNVESCSLTMDLDRNKIIVQLACKQNMKRTHYISILEQGDLENVDSVDKCNSLTAPFKVFADIVSIFQTNEEELTIEASKKKVTIKNYLELMNARKKQVRTHLTLEPPEFDEYSITEETNITFCLKEWRALLLLAETLGECITINFQKTGEPVEFKVRSIGCFEITLILATITAEAMDSDPHDASIVEPVNRRNKNPTRKRLNESQINKELDNIFKRPRPNISSLSSTSEVPVIETPQSTNSNNLIIQNLSEPSRQDVVRDNNPSNGTEDIPSINNRRATIRDPVPDLENDIEVIFCRDSNTEDLSRTQMSDSIDAGQIIPGRISEEAIPDSPPSQSDESRRKNLQLFRRCFEPTFKPSDLTGLRDVLADDSDQE